MLRANSLAAAAVLGAGFLRAQPAGYPAAASAPLAAANHFDAGRRAFRQGQYELTLREMMMAIISRPSDARAREYMRQASERLIAQDLDKADGERRALLKGYREALERGRRQAEIWNGWLLQAEAEAGSGLWARAYDDAQRVLDDNPGHEDARDMQQRAARGVARTLAFANTLKPKNLMIYRGLFLLVDRQPEAALKTLREALILEEAAELEDQRIKAYIAKLTPAPVVPAVEVSTAAAPAAAPQIEAPRPPAVAVAPRPKKKKKEAPAPLPQPGQWAYAQGMKQIEAVQYEEAIELFERALQEAPDHAQARQALLRARLALEEDVKRRKAGAEKLYELGLMLYGQGHRLEAAEHWRRALALSAEHDYSARALAHAEQELEEERK